MSTATGAPILTVLLHVATFVGDVQARDDAGSDDAGAVARRWWRSAARPMDREQQTDLIGTTQVQVGADDGFEEASTPERLAEDLSEPHLHEPAVAAAWSEGHTMTLEQAFARVVESASS